MLQIQSLIILGQFLPPLIVIDGFFCLLPNILLLSDKSFELIFTNR